MDMDVYGGDDFKVVPKGKRKAYEVDYESLSQSAVERLIKEDVDYICSVCGVDVSRILLFILSVLAMLRAPHRKASPACSSGI